VTPVDDAVWDAFDGRPHELRMGLRPLDPAAWTVVADAPAHAAELDRKAALLATNGNDTIAAVDDPAAHAASAELATMLTRHVVADHPTRYQRDGTILVLVDDGRRWDPADFDPLDLCGRIVAEDWCLVRPGDPPVLAAATVCSPNRWRLREKVGRPIAAVHDPVPGYRRRLGAPVDAVLNSRREPSWRRNWSMQSSPSLFQPERDGPAAPRVPDQVWVRSEYETLVRLPTSGWWVFGIRTRVRPLGDLAGRPEVARRVRAAVASLDPDTAAYKDLVPWHAPLVEWLGVVSGS
jgi:hypothetical protein